MGDSALSIRIACVCVGVQDPVAKAAPPVCPNNTASRSHTYLRRACNRDTDRYGNSI